MSAPAPLPPDAAPGRTEDTVRVFWFDGQHAQGRPARLRLEEESVQVLDAVTGRVLTACPARQARWTERTQGGTRTVTLADGSSAESLDRAAWDAWATTHLQAVRPESLVVRAQQSGRRTLLALLVLGVLLLAAYRWGLPLMARGVVTLIPPRIDAMVGDSALQSVEGQLLAPSRLPAARQAALTQRLQAGMAALAPAGGARPTYRLLFRSAPRMGPNAFALPGGTIVLLDELVTTAGNDDDMVLGVLGHEMGHVVHRDGMRQLVQTSALGVVAAAAFGDYASFVTMAPVLLLNMGYSRGAEHQADVYSVRFMRAAGISPQAMVRFFERMQALSHEKGAASRPSRLGIAFSSHPATVDRIAFFQAAARGAQP